MHTDRGRLLIKGAGVLVDQYVRHAARSETHVDREQLGLVRDAEYDGDGSRGRGTTFAGGVCNVGGDKPFWEILADHYEVGLGDAARRRTRSGISLGGLREWRERSKALSVNGSTCQSSCVVTHALSRDFTKR